VVTMSQKSSLLQPANSVSQVLIPDKHSASAKLAEGEELGSNLLRVSQSSPGYPRGIFS